MSTSVEDVASTAESGADADRAGQGDAAAGAPSAPPGLKPGLPGLQGLKDDWRVACELRTGAELIFDRGSLRELGAMTLVRWAAPGDPRVNEPVYTALVSCGEKTIEATWPGRRSGTRAGTCGRRLVDAVCDSASAAARRSRAARHAVE